MSRPLRGVGLVVTLVVTSAAALASALGCSDGDPNYGPPDAIRGRSIDFGIEASGDETGDTGIAVPPSDKSAPELFAELFDTLTDATQVKGSTCLPCHATTQNPMFMGATSEDTRTRFKSFGFDVLATSRFFLKGQHEGDPLTSAQKVLTQQWAAAEHDGGGG